MEVLTLPVEQLRVGDVVITSYGDTGTVVQILDKDWLADGETKVYIQWDDGEEGISRFDRFRKLRIKRS